LDVTKPCFSQGVVRQRLAICWKSCLRTGRAAAARTSPTHAGEEGDLEAAGGQPGPTKLTGATIMSAQTYSQTELTGAATYSAATYSFPVALLDQLDLVLAEEAPRSLRRTLRRASSSLYSDIDSLLLYAECIEQSSTIRRKLISQRHSRKALGVRSRSGWDRVDYLSLPRFSVA
jgi:hypothetical protein